MGPISTRKGTPFHGGDTRLGPWIYKTRSAIGRTLQNLSRQSSFLHKPFEWYGNLFLRVTMAISRGQELSADRLAAGIFGPRPLGEGLLNVSRGAMAFSPFWANEAVPVLGSGFHPPIAEGFSQFLRSEQVAKAVEEGLKHQLAGNEPDNPYDSHPPLRARLAALELPGEERREREDSDPAISLLENVPALEQDLITFGMDAGRPALQAIPWSEVGERVYIPVWRKMVEARRNVIGTSTVRSIPDRFPQADTSDHLPATEQHERKVVVAALSSAMAIALHTAGWELHADLGKTIVFTSADREVRPFEMVSQLAAGQLTPEAFLHEAETLGVADLDL